MPLAVRGQAFNVRSDSPKASDVFLVDTNVWVRIGYTKASQGRQDFAQRANAYASYLKAARANGSAIVTAGVSFGEIAHAIEKLEFELFEKRTGATGITLKDFRRDYPAERATVVAEIEGAWNVVLGLSEIVPAVIDAVATVAAINDLAAMEVDGYDLLILQAARAAGATAIITEDSDFLSTPGLLVGSAHIGLLKSANDAGARITR